jgi:hypothetical protein
MFAAHCVAPTKKITLNTIIPKFKLDNRYLLKWAEFFDILIEKTQKARKTHLALRFLATSTYDKIACLVKNIR